MILKAGETIFEGKKRSYSHNGFFFFFHHKMSFSSNSSKAHLYIRLETDFPFPIRYVIRYARAAISGDGKWGKIPAANFRSEILRKPANRNRLPYR